MHAVCASFKAMCWAAGQIQPHALMQAACSAVTCVHLHAGAMRAPIPAACSALAPTCCVLVPGPDFTAALGLRLSFRMCHTKHCLLRQLVQSNIQASPSEGLHRCACSQRRSSVLFRPTWAKMTAWTLPRRRCAATHFPSMQLRSVHGAMFSNHRSAPMWPSSWHPWLHFVVWPGHMSYLCHTERCMRNSSLQPYSG